MEFLTTIVTVHRLMDSIEVEDSTYQGRLDVLKKPDDGWSNAFTVGWTRGVWDCGMLLWAPNMLLLYQQVNKSEEKGGVCFEVEGKQPSGKLNGEPKENRIVAKMDEGMMNAFD